jgi:hypothetical protein
MATKLIEFDGGILVEVGVERDHEQEMSATEAERLGKRFEVATEFLKKVAAPIQEAFVQFYKQSQAPVRINSAEVELGLSFSTEGNLFVAKGSAEAALKVTLAFKALPKRAAKT